jgi:hypothetical protein
MNRLEKGGVMNAHAVGRHASKESPVPVKNQPAPKSTNPVGPIEPTPVRRQPSSVPPVPPVPPPALPR